MSFGIELYPSLVCLFLGGIITAVFIKILDWQRREQHTQARVENGEERVLPIQEEGDESVRLNMGRAVQGYTIRPRKLPCEQEETMHLEI